MFNSNRNTEPSYPMESLLDWFLARGFSDQLQSCPMSQVFLPSLINIIWAE